MANTACVHRSSFRSGIEKRQRDAQAKVDKCHSEGHSRMEKGKRIAQARKS